MSSQSDKKNDFSRGPMWKSIMAMAIPMIFAQLVTVLYNTVDRIYIGHMDGEASLALTGLGIAVPVISFVTAFTRLFSSGGAPLCSIERGRGNDETAEKLIGNCFSLMMLTGVVLMIVFYIIMKPMLYAFGASDATYPYASAYLRIYLLGTLFVMTSTGMNLFINSQGFGRMGLVTTLFGAGVNILLDPLFIFVFKMGVQGAAWATVLSQFLSAAWVIRFLTGDKGIYKLKKKYLIPDDWKLVGRMLGLGISGFVMGFTNSLVSIVCNSMLQTWGGDLYVGTMTIINSTREIFELATFGFTHGAQPVLGYNYGAGEYKRVRDGIKFMSITAVAYTFCMWLLVRTIPGFFVGLFTQDQALITVACNAIVIYFGGFFMQSLQMSGQSVFVALGCSKRAVFFSLLRKAFIVAPLTLILPHFLGVNGVYTAEPVSNVLGGLACFITMMLTVWPTLKADKVPVTKN